MPASALVKMTHRHNFLQAAGICNLANFCMLLGLWYNTLQSLKHFNEMNNNVGMTMVKKQTETRLFQSAKLLLTLSVYI